MHEPMSLALARQWSEVAQIHIKTRLYSSYAIVELLHHQMHYQTIPYNVAPEGHPIYVGAHRENVSAIKQFQKAQSSQKLLCCTPISCDSHAQEAIAPVHIIVVSDHCIAAATAPLPSW